MMGWYGAVLLVSEFLLTHMQQSARIKKVTFLSSCLFDLSNGQPQVVRGGLARICYLALDGPDLGLTDTGMASGF